MQQVGVQNQRGKIDKKLRWRKLARKTDQANLHAESKMNKMARRFNEENWQTDSKKQNWQKQIRSSKLISRFEAKPECRFDEAKRHSEAEQQKNRRAGSMKLIRMQIRWATCHTELKKQVGLQSRRSNLTLKKSRKKQIGIQIRSGVNTYLVPGIQIGRNRN